ncbi:acyl-CoA dehydrogenase family protein [Streptomyces sp. NPDC050617]|uniref:acyl-CoA dehydrogenase family protein n=1 Tax=Streptomyces sp. NPDC050617 TaxID=3154628 RepID=UPI00343817F6
MRSLDQARAVCERYHPGLGQALEAVPPTAREAPGSPVIDLFRKHGGVSLLVPRRFGGQGADPVDGVRVMRAIGSYSPSLAAAVAMHHFTVAMLYALAAETGRLTPAQSAVLGRVVPEQLLLASGWAEGRTRQNILLPSVTARPDGDGYRLNGGKKPCSLSRSMDLLTASIAVEGPGGASELALALIPAGSEGISVQPFWGNDVLAGAESDEVRLREVYVPRDLVIHTTAEDPHRLDDLQQAGFVWFELLVAAGYAGAASALAGRVLDRERGSVPDRSALAVRVESSYALLEGTARAVRDGLAGDDAVAAVLVARFAAQEMLGHAADLALELLGGIDFIRSGDSALLAHSVRPLAFHPPSRTSTADALVAYFCGAPLILS